MSRHFITAAIAIAVLAPIARADEAFAVGTERGRLVLVTADSQEPERWHGTDFEDSSPSGYFNARVFVRADALNSGSIELGGWRQNFHDWQVIDFSLSQANEAKARYTVRTPVDMPDVTFEFAEPNTTLLLIRHPELRALLDDVLADVNGLGAGEICYQFDPAVHAQVEPASFSPDPAIADAVATLLPRLASSNWRERDRAESALIGLGRDAALVLLLRTDRETLTPEQRRIIDDVCSQWPILSARDVALCRSDPKRIQGVCR